MPRKKLAGAKRKRDESREDISSFFISENIPGMISLKRNEAMMRMPDMSIILPKDL